jgi:hypothetical protein
MQHKIYRSSTQQSKYAVYAFCGKQATLVEDFLNFEDASAMIELLSSTTKEN